ncbi:ribonuclease HI [Sphingomonas sp. Root710]|uniref:ribonuclease HI n=1 Tax=Sphingomonas sp. Root710 TaxID=1736594 RepID=UPI001F1E6697|nr:reverse transcriptase-like protein [Sphingomonas sp. Root710]
MNDIYQRPVKLWFDGGCRPNPGPIETAVVLRGVADIRRGAETGGNERAEWLALFHALEIAAAHALCDIILIGDSLSVIRQASGVQRGEVLHIERFRALAQDFDRVRLRHVGRSHNLAGTALERARWGR